MGEEKETKGRYEREREKKKEEATHIIIKGKQLGREEWERGQAYEMEGRRKIIMKDERKIE